MLTLQSNKEIRINKGDTGMAPLFINIGDNLRPIGYEFRKPIQVRLSPEYLYVLQTEPLNTSSIIYMVGTEPYDRETLYIINNSLNPNTQTQDRIVVTMYEDAWRERAIIPGQYTFAYRDGKWYMTINQGSSIIVYDQEVDISSYGFEFPPHAIIQEPSFIYVDFELLDNDSEIMFQMWPILEIPEVPTLKKIILPKENKVTTYLYDEIITMENINTVNSYGEILLKFKSEDTEQLERGKYLYNIKANLFNKYSNEYEIKTILNRTPFYIIDDNFSQRIW